MFPANYPRLAAERRVLAAHSAGFRLGVFQVVDDMPFFCYSHDIPNSMGSILPQYSISMTVPMIIVGIPMMKLLVIMLFRYKEAVFSHEFSMKYCSNDIPILSH